MGGEPMVLIANLVENRFGRTCFVEAVPIGADE